MLEKRIPEWLRHSPTPGIRGFAVLAAAESVARGILVSVFPIAMYNALGDAETVSKIYFYIGVLSLVVSLFTPWMARFIPRRTLFTIATVCLGGGACLSGVGGYWLLPAGLALMTVSTVVVTICFNAYVMDFIERNSLGACETMRLFYSGAAWAFGPVAGVWLMELWRPAPFVISAIASLGLLAVFWYLRLGNGKNVAKARAPTPNPLAFLSRFLAQPRLVAGWIYAVVRSCGWWVYVVYLPIYAVENGYSDQIGGITLSITNGFLFTVPLMLRWMNGRVRLAVRIGFACSGLAFFLAAVVYTSPGLAILLLMTGSFFLILLDMCAGLPFLMAVRPSERTEMSAVYSTYRDVSGVVTPGVAWMVLLLAPLYAVFAATGASLGATALLARNLHPRLGLKRLTVPHS